ncbi:hypothetical protein OSTOST_21845, partial [Ostertagia ostertagi]
METLASNTEGKGTAGSCLVSAYISGSKVGNTSFGLKQAVSAVRQVVVGSLPQPTLPPSQEKRTVMARTKSGIQCCKVGSTAMRLKLHLMNHRLDQDVDVKR